MLGFLANAMRKNTPGMGDMYAGGLASSGDTTTGLKLQAAASNVAPLAGMNQDWGDMQTGAKQQSNIPFQDSIDTINKAGAFDPRSTGQALGGTLTSDEKAKGNKATKESPIESFLEAADPYTYRYKNPADEPTPNPTGGRYLGVMAQNIEKSQTGDTIVKKDARGMRYLEGGALMSALAASVGHLHDRLKRVENKKAK